MMGKEKEERRNSGYHLLSSCYIVNTVLGPFHTLILNSQKTQGGSYLTYKGKQKKERKREEEERNEGGSDMAQPCVFPVTKQSRENDSSVGHGRFRIGRKPSDLQSSALLVFNSDLNGELLKEIWKSLKGNLLLRTNN